jgi:hypothetical protein
LSGKSLDYFLWNVIGPNEKIKNGGTAFQNSKETNSEEKDTPHRDLLVKHPS